MAIGIVADEVHGADEEDLAGADVLQVQGADGLHLRPLAAADVALRAWQNLADLIPHPTPDLQETR